MIAHLSGTIAEKFGACSIVIDVHGVGYEVSVAAGDFDAVIAPKIGRASCRERV